MNDILSILERGGLKELKSFSMKFIKKYICPKCGYSFSRIIAGNFLRGTMPQCPVCGGNEIKTDDRIEKKQKK